MVYEEAKYFAEFFNDMGDKGWSAESVLESEFGKQNFTDAFLSHYIAVLRMKSALSMASNYLNR